MKIGAKILTILVLCLCTLSKAQNHYLADTNFVKALKATRPQVLNGDSLIISEAEKITGYLNLSNRNIYNADGVQFFSNVVQLDLAKNNLTHMPNIDHFTAIKDLLVLQNKLTYLPKVPKGIKIIYAFENQLTSVDNLKELDSLTYLHISLNKLTQIPDLINFPNLTKLHINSNQLTEVNGLEHATKLLELYAWGNKITNLDKLSNNTTLTNFVVYNNNLSSLPKLTNKTKLKNAVIHSNYLTFKDVYPLKSIPLFDTIVRYYQMKAFVSNYTVNSYDDNVFTVQSTLDQGIKNLNYSLFTKENTLVETNVTGIFTLLGSNFSDKDTFYIKITSTTIPYLELVESKWALNKIVCKTFLPEYISVLENKCTNGASIKMFPETLDPQFVYSFTSISLGENYVFENSLTLNSIPQGPYVLKVHAPDKCNVSKTFTIPNASNCDNIFSPNDDGIKDTYFFDRKGEIKILNTKGEIVKILQGPVAWDGKDNHGNIVPLGYYSIIIANAIITHLTVMK